MNLGRLRAATIAAIMWTLSICPPLARAVGRVTAWRELRRKVSVGELQRDLEPILQRLKGTLDVLLKGLDYERGCRIGVSFQVLALCDELALFVGQQKQRQIRQRVATRANRMIEAYNARLQAQGANRCRFYLHAGTWQTANMGDPCVLEQGHHEGEEPTPHESGLENARRTAELADGPRIVVP